MSLNRLAAAEPSLNCVPDWLPEDAIHYLNHTSQGRSIRQIARETGCHASTISRQIRRLETRRDDPLIDKALERLGERAANQQEYEMKHEKIAAARDPQVCSTELPNDAVRLLRRLAESGAVLAVSQDLDNAVVVRELPGGKIARTAVASRDVTEAMALNDWITCERPGSISRYRISAAGRAALKRYMSRDLPEGLAEALSPFAVQHMELDEREIEEEGDRRRRVKCNLAESPLSSLARRKDKDGQPFLADEFVAAGERLREDFELAQMGPRVAQNWERFLTAGDRGGFGGRNCADGPSAARERVALALRELGPGLEDVALRCCCFLEGIETIEKRMGWSARSGKVVLRIALQRLALHYERLHGRHGPLIG
ncbi:DUF6456 domain-containing protein [Qingshengfaniella alkalisoli]|uniref:Helix-turn-helix domain-containing protein n=1 Tax=Qingshengfaniella alkalisoli TaxID=2599296 RepID=A0A5B8I6B3_9RHOB|nr:DUF6456 domain-containing protein [Qingshengfaniella alkalisoli]QDY68939.1 helix-turn-helix domain-containing protein [Qingshengfaniella alkalisoli]